MSDWRMLVRPIMTLPPSIRVVCCYGIPILLSFSSASAVDKSGVTPTSVSLPSGPGSIEGLGSEFQPHLNTGTSSYNIPISLPGGTAGHTPTLSLNYEGGFGNSSMGIAWSLPVQSIRRQCEKGIPRYEPNGRDDDFDGLTDEADEQDRFLDLSGEELILMDNGVHYPKNQEQFIRWRHHVSGGQDYWEGLLPSGVIQQFGLTEESQVREGDRIYKWCLKRIIDTNGNVIEYDYAHFPGSNNQIHLSAIRYGPGAPPWTAFYMATFTYEDRPDTLDDYRGGFLVRTAKRLKRIDVALQGDLPDGHLVGDINEDGIGDAFIRTYVLHYDTHPHWSLLSKVTLIGADGVSALPSANFEYGVREQPRVVSAANSVIGTKGEPLKVMDNDFVDLVDLNADGLPDILRTELGGQHLAHLNQGVREGADGPFIQWGPPMNVDSTANGDLALGRNLNEAEVSLTDVDGDGLADLVLNSQINPRFYSNQGNVSWGPTRIIRIEDGEDFPPAPHGNAGVRTVDLDFDKNIDIIRPISGGYQVWYSLGRRGSDSPGAHRYSPRVLAPGASHQGDHLRFADELGATVPGMTLADLNGDRIIDVAHIRPTSVIFAPSMGYGEFAESRVMPIPTDDGFGHDQGFAALSPGGLLKAELIDITGNGLADLVVRGEGFRELWYWINLGNGAFDQRRIVTQLPTAFSNPNPEIRWADMNGNGTDDLVYSDSQLEPGQKLRTIDLGLLINGDPCPFLMTALENGIGMRTEITYRPSTAYAVDDLLAGKPWAHPVPNTTIVVAKVATFDGLGNEYVTRFGYHDGFYDGVEKEFRGFERAMEIAIGDSSQPTLVSDYEFDVGRIVEALKGKTLKSTTRTEQGQVFAETVSHWETRSLFAAPSPSTDGHNPKQVTFPFMASSMQIVHEAPGGAATPVVLVKEFAYDDYGNQVMSADFGRVTDGDGNFGNDERIQWTVYSATPEAPIWNAVVETARTDRSNPPRLVSHSRNYFDGRAFQGLPHGSVPVGNRVRSQRWVGPFNPANPPTPLPDPAPRLVEVIENDDRTLNLSILDEQHLPVGDDVDHWIETERNEYDSYGNKIVAADPLASISEGIPNFEGGHFKVWSYDPLLHLFPVREDVYTGETTLTFRIEYDAAFGTIVSSTEYNGHTTQYGYDPFARLVKIVKPGGDPPDTWDMPTLAFDYRLAVPVDIADGTGLISWTETRAHEVYGNPTAYFVTRNFIDGLKRTVMRKEEDESLSRSVVAEAHVFNARGQVRKSLVPFYGRSGMEFEDIRQPGWSGTWFVEGSERQFGLADAPSTVTDYDETGRKTVIVQPDGSFSRIAHLPLVTRTEDENDTDVSSKHFGTPTLRSTDGLGRLIELQELVRLNDDGTPRPDVVSWRTAYEYDLLNNLTAIVDSQGNRRSFRFDALERLTYVDDPNRGRLWFTYDDASNLVESVDAKGQAITQTFDGVNRILTEDYRDEGESFSLGRSYDPLLPIGGSNQPDVAYFYDFPAASASMEDGSSEIAANTMGFLSHVIDLSGEEHSSYDERARIAWEIKRIPDPQIKAPVSFKTEITYDAMDRIVGHRFPDGDRVSYEYNGRALLEKVHGGRTANLDGSPFILSGIEYIPTGQRRVLNYGNGVTTSILHDRRMRVSRLRTVHGNDPRNPLLDYVYRFDSMSNIERIEDLRNGVERDRNDPRRNGQVFEYDDLYRLSRVQHSFSLPGEPPRNDGMIDHRYDRIGNMLFRGQPPGEVANLDSPGVTPAAFPGEMSYGGGQGSSNRIGRGPSDGPGPSALTSTTEDDAISYDANGNLEQHQGRDLTWDYRDRLVAVEDNRTLSKYTYDYAGRRVVKEVWGKDSDGQVDPSIFKSTLYVTPNYEVREFDQPIKYVFDGESRVARITGTFEPEAPRIQMFRLHAGWNVFSPAVESPDIALQIAEQSDGLESIGHRWDPTGNEYTPIELSDNLGAGDVIWIRCNEPQVLRLVGSYVDPVNQSVEAGNGWVSAKALEAVDLERFLPSIAVRAWFHDSWRALWRSRFTKDDEIFSFDPPPFLRPGAPVFIESDSDFIALPPDPGSRILYYHGDHIGSANIIVDAKGNIVEETVFHPYGDIRSRVKSDVGGKSIPSNYLFSQKELDEESGLQYFETRLLQGSFGRFASVDPLVSTPPMDHLGDPQMLAPYAFARNNPIRYGDPTGMAPEPIAKFETKKGVTLGENIARTVKLLSQSGDKSDPPMVWVVGRANQTMGGDFIGQEKQRGFVVLYKRKEFESGQLKETYTEAYNINWIADGVKAGADFLLASPLKLSDGASNLMFWNAGEKAFNPTYFGREVSLIRASGYELSADGMRFQPSRNVTRLSEEKAEKIWNDPLKSGYLSIKEDAPGQASE